MTKRIEPTIRIVTLDVKQTSTKPGIRAEDCSGGNTRMEVCPPFSCRPQTPTPPCTQKCEPQTPTPPCTQKCEPQTPTPPCTQKCKPQTPVPPCRCEYDDQNNKMPTNKKEYRTFFKIARED